MNNKCFFNLALIVEMNDFGKKHLTGPKIHFEGWKQTDCVVLGEGRNREDH